MKRGNIVTKFMGKSMALDRAERAALVAFYCRMQSAVKSITLDMNALQVHAQQATAFCCKGQLASLVRRSDSMDVAFCDTALSLFIATCWQLIDDPDNARTTLQTAESQLYICDKVGWNCYVLCN